jgi:uncharacterized protein (TIGR02145 family)/uncharacterized repeat protein (TIGR02543 family)
MPTDPFNDPRNLDIGLFLEGNKISALAGDSIKVGVTVNIPKLVMSLKSIDGDENAVRILSLKDPLSKTPDTIFFKTLYKTPGSKTVTIRAMLSDNITTDFPFEIVVLAPTDKIIFDTIPPKDTTVFDTKTTVFRIVSHTVSSSVIKYSLSSSPALPDSCYKIEGTGSSLISITPPKPGVYGLKIAASNGTLKDSVMMTMNVVASPAVTVAATNKSTQIGVPDTLVFTGSEKDSLTLDNPGSYKPGEITGVVTGLKNVVKLVFTPQESKEYMFSVRVTGVSADNIRYNDVIIVKKAVTGSVLSVWKMDTLSISTPENSVISKSLDSLLVNPALTDITFGCDKGTITQSLWSDSIHWGAGAVDSAVIVANYKGNAYPLKIFIRASAADVSQPYIVLVNPSTADATISSNVITCKVTITDSLSGVGSVIFRIGTTVLTDTLHSGDTYQCIVKDLPKGVKTTLSIDVIDRSQKKNPVSKDISLTYNPDIEDNVGPVISMKDPLTATFTVSAAEKTVLISCTDQSGIRSVKAMKGATELQVQKTDSIYSIAIGSLTAGKTDTVVVTAIDSSAASISSTLSLYVKYEPSMLDKQGPLIILKSPANNASVAVPSVTMSVVCRDESKIADADYKFGTITGKMTKENDSTFSAVVSGLVSGKNQITISAKDASVNSNPTDSVFTITYDPTMNDTIKPVITCPKATRDTLLVNSASTTIEVNCTDSSGIDKVTCTMGTTVIPVTGSGTLYSATVSGLVAGANTFVFTATDKAAKPNSVPKTIVVMYDPTATDVTGPVIKLSSPSQDRTKVAQPSATLTVVCRDDNRISAVTYALGSLNGAMTKDNDSTFSVALSNLVKGDNQITIVATDSSSKKNATDTVFTIVYDPTMNDTVAPVITLKTPVKDSTTVSSKSMTLEVVCTDSSGIDTVTCKAGTTDVPVVRAAGDVFSVSVTTLVVGPNTFTFTASDKASTKRSSTKSVTVFYDPTIIDNVAPTVAIRKPQNADSRVLTDTFTVQINCTDDNGIYSVTATRGGAPVTGITKDGSLYSVKVLALTPGKSDTIIFNVVDSSSNKNANPFPVILRYNRNPIAATLGTPADGATGVAKSPTFTWSEGTDPDGDPVTYTLRYGTSATALSGTVPNLTVKTYTMPQALSAAVKYYWQVVTHTAVNGDSAVSGIAAFTTVENAPVITADPEPKRTKVGGTATFTVTASSTVSTPKYQWQKGTTNVTTGTGGTTSSYTTAAAVAGDNGSTYRCIVTNDGGADTSTPATLTIVYSVIYNGNSPSEGTVPTDAGTYASGEEVTVKTNSGSLVRTGYSFAGWNSNASGSGTNYAADGTGKLIMGSGDATLYARWTSDSYSITYYIDGTAYSTTPSSYNVTTPTFNLPRPTKTGYTLSSWYSTQDLTGTPVTSITIGSTGNKAYYAKWTPENYSIAYIIDGEPVTLTPSSYNITTPTFNLPIPTRTGYTLSSWYSTENYTGTTVTAITIGTTGAKTYYARWLQTYTVTYHANGGGLGWGHGSSGTLPNDTRQYATGATVTALRNTGNLTKYGYSFDGWSRTETYGINDDSVTTFTMGNKNETLYARWVIKDASGNKYTEVNISGQVWMAQNLRTTKFNDGTDIPMWNVGGNLEMARFYPGDATYGAYYNGYAAAQDTNQMLAPPGWHIIKGGVEYAGFQYASQGIAKNLASTQYWKTGSSTDNAPGQQPSLNNSSQFNAIPSGYFAGQVFQRGEQAEFWMNNFYTEEGSDWTTGQTMFLNWDAGYISTKTGYMTDYHSVRCIRDF